VTYKSVFAAGAVLFVLTLAMNLVSIRLVRRYREVYD
jgi:phosphate transport system permease protein